MHRAPKQTSLPSLTFVDLFAGCGGLSLGLALAGWKGLFAIEHERNAFSTLRANFLHGIDSRVRYHWPEWLPQEPTDIALFARTYHRKLRELRGTVDLVAGGPPCQGFSFAGRRRQDDHRNELVRHYLRIIALLRPRILLIENVQGIAVPFRKGARAGDDPTVPVGSHAERIKHVLEEQMGYRVFTATIRAAVAGVPQLRPRFFMLGVRHEIAEAVLAGDDNPLEGIQDLRRHFLRGKGLPVDRPVTASDALSDLETQGDGKVLIACYDTEGFQQLRYSGPETLYQRLMRDGMKNEDSPNSMRLVNHRPATTARFSDALQSARSGVTLNLRERQSLGIMKKHQFTILNRDRPSHTLTTVPDDLIHYSEPRILTVREYARLQSFPDWFAFHGNYTTGGDRRAREAPRYTQAGNAVPPLLAELLGLLLRSYIDPSMERPTSSKHHEAAQFVLGSE